MNPVEDDYVKVVITVSISGTHQMQRLLIALRNVVGIEKVFRAKSS